MLLASLLQILLYFGIIALVVYWLFPLHDNIEKYFANKVVWITGASSGIGRELAKQLAQHSPTTKLIISARREQELHALQKELNLDFQRCLVLPLDLELQQDCFKSKVDLALERFGRIDVLINNAGISQRSFIRDTVYKVDARLMNINFLGTVTLSKAVLQHFIEQQSGHFVVVTSAAGYAGTALRSTYAASKHALHGFFDSLRLEHTRDHIDVTIVCPGFIRTDISHNAFDGSGLLHGKMDPQTDKGTDPAVCALDILRGVANREHEIYVGRMSSLVIYLRRFFPWLLTRVLLRVPNT